MQSTGAVICGLCPEGEKIVVNITPYNVILEQRCVALDNVGQEQMVAAQDIGLCNWFKWYRTVGREAVTGVITHSTMVKDSDLQRAGFQMWRP